MALNKDRLGDAIVDRILTFSGVVPIPADETQMRNLWKAISEEIIDEIKNFADINLATSDIPVLPGTFQAGGNPVTGVAVNDAVVLGGKIE